MRNDADFTKKTYKNAYIKNWDKNNKLKKKIKSMTDRSCFKKILKYK